MVRVKLFITLILYSSYRSVRRCLVFPYNDNVQVPMPMPGPDSQPLGFRGVIIVIASVKTIFLFLAENWLLVGTPPLISFYPKGSLV